MEAGSALDAKIASTLMGAFVVIEAEQFYMVSLKKKLRVKLPEYSTNTDDAYKLVSAFQERGWFFRVINDPMTNSFYCAFYKQPSTETEYANAKTLPLAICMAALNTGDKLY